MTQHLRVARCGLPLQNFDKYVNFAVVAAAATAAAASAVGGGADIRPAGAGVDADLYRHPARSSPHQKVNSSRFRSLQCQIDPPHLRCLWPMHVSWSIQWGREGCDPRVTQCRVICPVLR